MIGILLAIAMSQDYPDKSLTPGVTRQVSKQELCTVGSTKDARHVTAKMKREVLKKYLAVHPDWPTKNVEYDHFLSLELAGSNSEENLWPQKFCPIGNDPLKTGCLGAREKDFLETALHRQICKGKITIEQAQHAIITDWVSCYKLLKAGRSCQ